MVIILKRANSNCNVEKINIERNLPLGMSFVVGEEIKTKQMIRLEENKTKPFQLREAKGYIDVR